MATEKEIQEIKDLIEQELSFCEVMNTPFLCANLSSPEGKQKMIDLVFSYVVKRKIYINDAILEVERDFNPNIADNPYTSS